MRKRRGLRARALSRHKACVAGPTWIEDAGADAIAEAVARTLYAPGARRIAVPGGRTPAPILARLAVLPLDWPRVTIGLTDDRDVPHEHPASNFGLLRRTLGATGARLAPMTSGAVAPWHLVWLGMGEDGHVASIFPRPELDEALPAEIVRLVPDPLPPEAPFARLTQSYAALAATDAMMLVVQGGAKRAILEAALAGESDTPVARLLRRVAAPVTIYWSR